MKEFDELSLTYILSKLTIKEPNYMVTTPKGSLFSSDGLPLLKFGIEACIHVSKTQFSKHHSKK